MSAPCFARLNVTALFIGWDGFCTDLIWLNATNSLQGKTLHGGEENLREVRMSDLLQRVGYTVMFLRMTATEMLELAEHTPDIARELGHIAEQVQAEADALARHIAQ
jgi:hypothetical protein